MLSLESQVRSIPYLVVAGQEEMSSFPISTKAGSFFLEHMLYAKSVVQSPSDILTKTVVYEPGHDEQACSQVVAKHRHPNLYLPAPHVAAFACFKGLSINVKCRSKARSELRCKFGMHAAFGIPSGLRV